MQVQALGDLQVVMQARIHSHKFIHHQPVKTISSTIQPTPTPVSAMNTIPTHTRTGAGNECMGCQK